MSALEEISDWSEEEFEVFEIQDCPNCQDGNQISISDDGNRSQQCETCGTWLMIDGVLQIQAAQK